MIKYLYLFVFLLSICSCKQKIMDFDQFDICNKVTDYDLIFSDSVDMIAPVTNMLAFENYLLLKHRNGEYCFSVIDVNSCALVSEWGKLGQGNNEFLKLGSDFCILDSLLVFMDINRKEFNLIPVHNVIENKYDEIQRFKYPYTLDFRPIGFTAVDNKYLFMGSFKEGRFGGLDIAADSLFTFSDFKFDCVGIPQIYKGIVYQGVIKGSSRQQKIACITRFTDLLEIYSIKDDEIKKVFEYPYKEEPKIIQIDNNWSVDYEKSMIGLKAIDVSDDNIYLMYFTLGYEYDNNGFDQIFVFDWLGNKICRYILPIRIDKFCVGESCIYGVDYIEENINIYRFKI